MADSRDHDCDHPFGIVGFLLVHILNEKEEIDVHMTPRFVAFFAIVDTLGASVISVLGYLYLKATENESFLERWIDAYIKTNPRFFGGAR